ncbi:MAG: nucleotide exchange factor GrpE [Lachnospirales bacterium]
MTNETEINDDIIIEETEIDDEDVETTKEDEVVSEDSEDEKELATDEQKEMKTTTDNLDKLEKEKAELKDKLTRNLAEFDNFRKRTTKEKQSMYNEGAKDTIEKLLPTIDNFERALNTSVNKEDKFYIGVNMIFTQLIEQLTAIGVEEVEAMGAEFDPNVHHAVANGESEEYESNHVMEVLQKGYMYKERLLRPAMVKVVQ